MNRLETPVITRRKALSLLGAALSLTAVGGCSSEPLPPSVTRTHPNDVALLPEQVQLHMYAAAAIDQTTGDTGRSALWRSGVSLWDDEYYGSGSLLKNADTFHILTIGHVAGQLQPLRTRAYLPACEAVLPVDVSSARIIPTTADDDPVLYSFDPQVNQALRYAVSQDWVTPLQLGEGTLPAGDRAHAANLWDGGFDEFIVIGEALQETGAQGGMTLSGEQDVICFGESGSAVLGQNKDQNGPSNKVHGLVTEVGTFLTPEGWTSCGSLVVASPIR